MMTFSSFNPACYIPSAVNKYLPSAVACPPPPSFFYTIYNTIISPINSTYGTVRAMLEAFVGLPFLSVIMLLTNGGWSTTINIFFFYITWSTLVLAHPPLRVELIGSLAIRLVFYVIPSLLFLTFDTLLPSTAEGFKAYGAEALPFANASSRRKTMRQLRILGWSLANILLATLLQLTIEVLLTQVLLVRSAVRVTTSLPAPISILKNLAQGYIIREILTYTIHRFALHERSHGKNIAAQCHQQWYHNVVKVPFPLSESYDHPLPYLLLRFLPTYLPAFLLRFHLLTYLIFLAVISLEETFANSGYCSSSALPMNFFFLGGIARHTNLHAVHSGHGNYGSVGLVDWIMGTAIGCQGSADAEAEGCHGETE
ncbi:hypothetical protein DV736_g1480, partial [Chaetothyriales sp. CBS 134916]